VTGVKPFLSFQTNPEALHSVKHTLLWTLQESHFVVLSITGRDGTCEERESETFMSLHARIETLQEQIGKTMLRDRESLSERLHRLLERGGRQHGRGIFKRLSTLEKQAAASVEERERRLSGVPALTYPDHLPITAKRHEIVEAIRHHQVLIVSGETGCGKSTQLPKMCLEAGRGITGKIGCTQPRRIAATTIARRIAEELGEEPGRSVGYKIRFTDRTSREGYIQVMTDGILLAETQGDRMLLGYDTLIIDEAHERSLNIDFILGILNTLFASRPELRVIISSATLDTEKFSQAFKGAPVVTVEGRMYPVEVEYLPPEQDPTDLGEASYVELAVKAVEKAIGRRPFGDILIFMPTEQDIRETCERLEGRGYPGLTVIPLFARLPASEQGRVYSVSGPKIVVATNVAETSLTIPGVRYVIDTGLARISTYQPRTRTRGLPITPISRASADQRKGRCGRVQHGVCIRLYSEKDYLSRPAFTPPEILRTNLAEVILRMLSLELGHPASFPFLDKPSARSIKDGFDLLVELGAVAKEATDYTLTPMGRSMARMPLDPRISRMMLEASREGCPDEVAVIASALSVQDPRERPAEKALQADQMHASFKDPDSDFLSLLSMWKRYHREWETLKTQNKVRKFCRDHFLSFLRMREWTYTHEQIMRILSLQNLPKPSEPPHDLYPSIHRSVLSGFLSNIALKKEKNLYLAARGREVMIFPGSTLFNKSAPWIVAAEMVKTSRLFARTTARIDPAWLELLGKAFCKYSYSDPHWERSRGEVRAYEQVSLFGLPIVTRRPVSYGPVHPEEAHGIFVQSALVEGDVKDPLPFLLYNRKLLETLSAMEDKLRRRDILVSEASLADFYSARLPGVCDLTTLKKLIRQRGGDEFLRLREDDLLLLRPDPDELEKYPDRISLGEACFDCTYKFSPGKPEDGVTVKIPAGLLAALPAEGLDWGVPGLFKEKVTALIKGLPKRYRKQLVPVSRSVELIVKELEQEGQHLFNSLADFVFRRFGVDIPASVWAEVEVPDYLRTRVSIVDHRGREVEASRDVGFLRDADRRKSTGVHSSLWQEAQRKWERTGLTHWDIGDLQDTLPLHEHLFAHLGLEPGENMVHLKLFPSREQALESHVRGVEVLLSLRLAKDLKHLKRSLTLPPEGVQGARYFGGVGAVEKDLYESVCVALLRKNVRTAKSFEEEAERAKTGMLSTAKVLKEQVVRVLQAYHQTRQTVHGIERANKGNPAVLALCADVRRDLDTLMPEHFLLFHPLERLLQMPRYLKALQIRAERGANDPGKDRGKRGQVEVALNALHDMEAGLGPASSQGKRDAVEAYRWMIEEFKVSLFAQELKTSLPVSAKRLEERRKVIERMV